MGSQVPVVSRRRPRPPMQWGERGLSWAQVEAVGSPGQHEEVVLEAQVVSGLEAGSTLHPLQTLERQIRQIISHSDDASLSKSFSFFLFNLFSTWIRHWRCPDPILILV